MPQFKALPPLEELQKDFTYDPATGELTHARAKSSKVKQGDKAGTFNERGYIVVTIKGRKYLAHRIAWFIYTGVDPINSQIDHKNKIKDDNSIDNLRLATNTQNLWNKKCKGYLETAEGKFHARIHHYGKFVHIGSFSTAEEAHAAYRSKAVELRGEFAPAEYDGRLLDSSPG